MKEQDAKVPAYFKICWDNAQEYRKVLKRAMDSGKRCRKQAKWIGLERVPNNKLERLEGRHFVETLDQVAKGIKSGLFNENGFICVNGTMHRICAPLPSFTQMTSIILWTKNGSDDSNPTWEKVFGAIVYNLHKLDKSFDEDNQWVADEMDATISALKSNSSVPRGARLKTGGTMVKTLGGHSGFGLLYNSTVKVPELASQNPGAKTVQKTERLKQLRMRMKVTGPLLQGRHWEFLHGFLPPFALQQMMTARQASGTTNCLGYPNTSAFGTYAYCASSHVDRDESATSGWVMKRPPQVKRDESNFVFHSHGVVVEMAEGMYWFWNAPKDFHGTTINEVALQRPKTYQKYMSTAPNRAQWTRATVLTSAVVAAAKRREDAQ
ncbi:hypothetical protein LshimejAT787_2400650 [Lyophyllum shimeji]|uniref:Uncharacterized protein n=1 Tax=Lyophyllum shimeji TaxID=47721 RepID=A0A9P3PYV5_LYOSH|nr:hypothetical protein LshimejAT787_2400650 [Lyophyllum shimeji]